MYRGKPAIIQNIESWIDSQKKFLDYIKKSERDLDGADRLSLVIASRAACSQIARTIKGFDAWLQNPLIIGLMPLEMIKEIQERLWFIMKQLTEFDITHTEKYGEYLKKVLEQGKTIPPIPMEEEEEKERQQLTYMR
ncbi:MAG: DUF2153 domain-containing protein [Candidatus Methanomethylicia archaeon]|nr:DUF2153 domain-containing protein [Candidatus Methanomethylicia archaeon]MDW7988537.1 DUF2153 family protein [Nitrososphaerota archaeon]